MPWEVEKRDSKFVVISKTSGRVVGTHKSREEAQQQVRALYANVPDASKSSKHIVKASEYRRH